MAESMIERVARALQDCDPSAGAPYELAARNVIEAMREPTQAMVSAMMWQVNDWQNEKGTDQDIWYAPIDAALEERT